MITNSCKLENGESIRRGRERSIYKLSDEGIKVINAARRKLGWRKMEICWLNMADCSNSTLRRFLKGNQISANNFKALCEAVGIEDWDTLIDWDASDSTKVSESIQEKLENQELGVGVSHPNSALRYRLVVSAVFSPANIDDIEEIEITLEHLLKFMKRKTVTMKCQDGEDIKEFKHLINSTSRYRLAVSAVFSSADIEEIEITLEHLLKLMKRGTGTIKCQDSKDIKEFRYPSQHQLELCL